MKFCVTGKPVLSAEHCKGLGDEAERYTPRRIEHVHEGSTSYTYSRALVRNPVRYISLEARKPFGWRSL